MTTISMHVDSLPIYASKTQMTWRFEWQDSLIDITNDLSKPKGQRWTATIMLDEPEQDFEPLDLRTAIERVATVTRGDLYDTINEQFLGAFILKPKS